MNGETVSEALLHRARGWAILPVGLDKQPNHALIRATRGGKGWKQLAETPADEDEIRAWLERDPASGIGVLTGEVSGLAVVDVDDPELGAPELPYTASVSTGRSDRAFHAYFRLEGSLPGKAFPWGELRADGEYVVAPHSRHASGAFYRWLVSPEERLEDFSASDFPAADTYIRSTCLKVRDLESQGPSDGRSDFANLERDEGVALRLAVALGVPEGVRIGETFPCLLHPDRNPSASLWRSWGGSHVLYRDWHGRAHGDEVWLSLAAVRARLAGRTGPLSVPELFVWKLRLAAEAGFLSPEPRARPVSVEDGFRELLELRWQLSPDLPAPFSARFAAAWCGISKYDAHDGLRELARRGVLRVVGRDPRGTRLWLPEEVVPLA